MILRVSVIPKSRRVLIEQDKENIKVHLTKPAEKGLANRQLIDILSGHFNVKKYQIRIIKGHNWRHKLIEISR